MHLDSDIKGLVKGVYVGCGILCAAEIVACAAISATGFFTFDLSMVLGAVGGTLIGMICFVWMAVSLQKSLNAAASGGPEVRRGVQMGYGQRMLLQGVWIVIAIFAPFVNTICALIPLLFPKMAIYLLQITGRLNLTQTAPEVKGGEP